MTDATGAPRPWDVEQYRTARSEGRTRRKRALRCDFSVDSAALFWEAFRASFLTIFTLGLYRFWMITKLRRRYWSSVRIDGDPLEYTGTGAEKLLGFLIALVILAVYLGAINLGLAYAGLSFVSDDPWAQTAVLQISVLATLPLIFYATYRSQRYILARTRWRGIRFGLEPGAWGYAGRAMLLTTLTVVTAGLAYPYQHYTLAKYITDRSWFGDLPFEQEGSWGELFAQWIWIYVVLGACGLIIWSMAVNPGDPTTAFFASLLVTLGFVAVVVLYQRYQVVAFRILWCGRHLADADFENDVNAVKVLGTYVGGGIATTVCAGLAGLVIILTGGYMVGSFSNPDFLEGLFSSDDPSATMRENWPVIAIIAIAYLMVFGLAFAFSQVFITRPVLAAKVQAMVLSGIEQLDESRQRGHDHAAEAGGFADALGVDVGPGI